ncbi:MAG TPA: hypothetical protein PKN31_06215, partial [Candidatus Atribacteria bacterium]|nr:hypothetical protein [Candidatus Atribacteria bacterium]
MGKQEGCGGVSIVLSFPKFSRESTPHRHSFFVIPEIFYRESMFFLFLFVLLSFCLLGVMRGINPPHSHDR